MSDQKKSGVITSLEEVFLSREFGREFQPVPVQHDSIGGVTEEGIRPSQLEQVFLSEDFGKPRVQGVAPPEAAEAGRIGAGRQAGTVLAFAPRESTRYRAVAAVSGIAAAALVVAGVTSGGGRTGPPALSALGHRVAAAAQGVGGTGTGSANPPGTGTAPAAGGVASPAQGGSVQLADTAGAESQVELQAGTPGATLVSSPASPAAAPVSTPPAPVSPGTGADASAPAPVSPTGPGAGDLISPSAAMIGNTVTALNNTVTTTAGQLGSAVSTLDPVTGAVGGVGATVSAFGQSLAAL
ncbi:MAG: hypothetical protein ACLQU9_04900 [Acidimicrobiales bacterium]|jgi:hypothetical protein